MGEIEEIRRKKMEKMKEEINRPAGASEDLPSKPITVTDATVDSLIAKYPLFILDCWAEWCGPCRTIGPIIEQLSSELKGKAVFGKLNVDENMVTANNYRISAIPTLLFFKNGKLIDKLLGAYPKPMLAARIAKHL